MATETNSPRWSQLPKDLLTLIAKRLDTRVDTLRLRSICNTWRSSIPPFKRPLPLPLNLPFPIAPNSALHRNRRGHYSLTDSTIYFLQPPPNQDSDSKSQASKGWLLRVEDADHGNGKFHPLNPLSKTLTENVPKAFPKELNLLDVRITEIGKAYSLQFVDLSNNLNRTFGEFRSMLFKKVVVSDYAVMAIHGGKLGFIKFGDEKWTEIDDPKQCDDVVYHKGNFYAVDRKGRTVVFGSDFKGEEIAAPMPGRGGGQFKYLIKSCENLFLIDKCMDNFQEICFDLFMDDFSFDKVNPDVQVHLRVFKLNEKEKEWEWVYNLGDRVFFLGDDCSYSVLARDFSGLEGNCIYFSEDEFLGKNEDLGELCPDTGVYCLEDGGRCGALSSFRSHSQVFWPPPNWLRPNPPGSSK